MAEEGMSFSIEPHALERFLERWQILHGKPLEESDVLPRLQGLILAAKPEPESDGLAKRNERYGGQNRYLMNGPWRFVFDGNRLVTVELRPMGSFADPRLYRGEILVQLYLRITEDIDETLIEKSDALGFSVIVPLVMTKMPEVNAIIRFLRLSGCEVRYKRTGTDFYKQAVLSVFLPKELRRFIIEEFDGRKVWLLFQGRESPYIISGIAPEDYETILDFVTNQDWFDEVKRAKELLREERERKIAEKRKRRRERLKKKKAEEPPKPSKRPISEILAISPDITVVGKELLKDYWQQIRRQECKLGKTWVLHYRFLVPGVEIYLSIRDAISLEEGRKLAIEQLVSQLQEKERGTR